MVMKSFLTLCTGDGGEDARTEDLSQDVRGFIFSKLLVCFEPVRIRGSSMIVA